MGGRKAVAQSHVEAYKHSCTGQYEAYEEKDGHAKAEGKIHEVHPWSPLLGSQGAEETFRFTCAARCYVIRGCPQIQPELFMMGQCQGVAGA